MRLWTLTANVCAVKKQQLFIRSCVKKAKKLIGLFQTKMMFNFIKLIFSANFRRIFVLCLEC